MQDRIRTIEKDLDLNNNFLVNCNCKQYDTIKFIFNMFMDGEVADLSDCIFRLQAKKGDGLPYINNNSDNISVIGNIVTIDNDNQLTARAGDTFAEVVITDKNGHMKTTFDIRLNIKSSAIDGLVDSEATITILDSLEEKLNKVDNIGTVLEEANTTEKSLNNLIPTGNILKDNLDSIIGTGSTLKNDLDMVVQSSSTLKDNLDIANILAESNIDELNKIGDVTDLAQQVQTNTTTIGTETIGTTATTLKGAIKEVKGIADNNTTQLNALANERGYERVKRFEVETDLNTLTESGVYASSKFLNSHDNDKTWKIVEVFNMSADNQIYCIQRIMGIADGGDRTFERRCNNGIWSEWIQLCYTKLENTNFAVSEGYNAKLNVVKRDSLGRTIVDGIIKPNSGVFPTTGALHIATLPSGFIPYTVVNQPIRSYRGNVNQSSDSTMLAVGADGKILISNIVDNSVEVQFHLVFDTK